MVQNMELVLKALRFAERKHEGQTRKFSGAEYLVHPFGVSYLVANFKKSKNLPILIAASILHDTVEDTETTFAELVEEFDMFIATLVFELTDDKVEMKKVGKLEYCKKRWFGLSSYALYIKLCDRLYNISDNPTDEAVGITKDLLDHIEEKRKLTQSQLALVGEIRRVIRRIEDGKKS